LTTLAKKQAPILWKEKWIFVGQMKRKVISAATGSWDLMLLFEKKDTMNLPKNDWVCWRM